MPEPAPTRNPMISPKPEVAYMKAESKLRYGDPLLTEERVAEALQAMDGLLVRLCRKYPEWTLKLDEPFVRIQETVIALLRKELAACRKS